MANRDKYPENINNEAGDRNTSTLYSIEYECGSKKLVVNKG